MDHEVATAAWSGLTGDIITHFLFFEFPVWIICFSLCLNMLLCSLEDVIYSWQQKSKQTWVSQTVIFNKSLFMKNSENSPASSFHWVAVMPSPIIMIVWTLIKKNNSKTIFAKIKSFITNTKEKHALHNQTRVDDTILHDPLPVPHALISIFLLFVLLSFVFVSTRDLCFNTPTSCSTLTSFRKMMLTEVLSAMMESNGNWSAGLHGVENKYIKLAANILIYL